MRLRSRARSWTRLVHHLRKHLDVLREAGVVSSDKRGRKSSIASSWAAFRTSSSAWTRHAFARRQARRLRLCLSTPHGELHGHPHSRPGRSARTEDLRRAGGNVRGRYFLPVGTPGSTAPSPRRSNSPSGTRANTSCSACCPRSGSPAPSLPSFRSIGDALPRSQRTEAARLWRWLRVRDDSRGLQLHRTAAVPGHLPNGSRARSGDGVLYSGPAINVSRSS